MESRTMRKTALPSPSKHVPKVACLHEEEDIAIDHQHTLDSPTSPAGIRVAPSPSIIIKRLQITTSKQPIAGRISVFAVNLLGIGRQTESRVTTVPSFLVQCNGFLGSLVKSIIFYLFIAESCIKKSRNLENLEKRHVPTCITV